MPGVQVDAAPHGRRRASGRLPVRVHPGRDLGAHTRPGTGRHLREPRDGKVPFPFATANPTAANGAERLRQLAGEPADPQPALGRGAQRLVRRSRAAPATSGSARTTSRRAGEGFDRDILFTNEESPDYVLRQEARGRPRSAARRRRQPASSSRSTSRPASTRRSTGWGGTTTRTASPIPGYDDLVVLSGDDTFTSGPLTDPLDTTSSSRTSHRRSRSSTRTSRRTPTRCWHDEGELWAFVATTAARRTTTTSPSDRHADHRRVHQGARSTSPAASTRRDGAQGGRHRLPAAADERELAAREPVASVAPGRHRRAAVGARVLEPATNNVFDFVRVEDIAYDKRPSMANVVYIVDSGRGRTAAQALDTPFRPRTGAIWKMVLDPNDPTIVTSLTVLVEGDDNPVKTSRARSTSRTTSSRRRPGSSSPEDPGSSQQFPAGSTRLQRDDGTSVVRPVLGRRRRSS